MVQILKFPPCSSPHARFLGGFGDHQARPKHSQTQFLITAETGLKGGESQTIRQGVGGLGCQEGRSCQAPPHSLESCPLHPVPHGSLISAPALPPLSQSQLFKPPPPKCWANP